MTFEPMRFIESLSYLWRGMLGIFAVIAVIMLVTVLLNKLTGRRNT